MMDAIIKILPESAMYFLRRVRFMLTQRDRYLKFKQLREGTSSEGYTLKPFEEFKCIFIHVPKCAGQSIRATLFPNLQPGHINIYTFQQIYPKKSFDNYFKFTFVRNPWDRLVSAYLFMKAGGAHRKDQDWADQNLAGYLDFDGFIRKGLRQESILRWPHFRPQVEFLKGQFGRIEVDFIGRLENINQDFKAVEERLGIDRELQFINRTQSKRESYRSYYSEELREIVGEIYREDIETFDYQF